MIVKQTSAARVVVLFGAIALAPALASCGGASESRAPSQTTTPVLAVAAARGAGTATSREGRYLHYDGDDDERTLDGPGAGNDDREQRIAYPHVATPTQRNAIAKVVRRYFEAAARGDTTTACAMLTEPLAADLGRQRADGCPATLSRMFSEERAQLQADDVGTMVLLEARLRGDSGIAVLGFRAAPEQSVLLERERREWRLASPLGSDPP